MPSLSYSRDTAAGSPCYTGNPRPSTLNTYLWSLHLYLQPRQTHPVECKPTLPSPTRTSPSPGFESLYDRLRAANNAEVGRNTDTFTKRTALFSGIEAKPTSGDKAEADLQISIWMAASLRKKEELAKYVAFKATLRGAEANVSASEMDVEDANRECDVNADSVDADDEDGDAHTNERNPNPTGDKEDTRDAHICDAQPAAMFLLF